MDRDVKAALGLFAFSYLVRLVDIFVLKSPALPRSIIMSKVVPLMLLLYVIIKVEKVGFEYIGLQKRMIFGNLFLGVVLLLFTLGYNYVSDLIMLLIYNVPLQKARFFFGGSIAYYLLFCTVNGLMEEGVFRGYMQRKFYLLGKWNAIFLQAFFFGIWHIVWTFYYFYDFSSGWTVSGVFAAGYTVFYVFFTFIFGIIMGYAFLKTGSLWGPVLCHTFYNFFLSFLLFNQTATGVLINFAVYPITASLCLLSIRFLADRMKMKEEKNSPNLSSNVL